MVANRVMLIICTWLNGMFMELAFAVVGGWSWLVEVV